MAAPSRMPNEVRGADLGAAAVVLHRAERRPVLLRIPLHHPVAGDDGDAAPGDVPQPVGERVGIEVGIPLLQRAHQRQLAAHVVGHHPGQVAAEHGAHADRQHHDHGGDHGEVAEEELLVGAKMHRGKCGSA